MQKMIRATISPAAQAKLEKAKREMFLGKKRPMSDEMRARMEESARDWNASRQAQIEKFESGKL